MPTTAPVLRRLEALVSNAHRSSIRSRAPFVLDDHGITHASRTCTFVRERHPKVAQLSLSEVVASACSGCFSEYTSFAGETLVGLDRLAAHLAAVEEGLAQQRGLLDPLRALTFLELPGFNWAPRTGNDPFDHWYTDLMGRLRDLEGAALSAVREPSALARALAALGGPMTPPGSVLVQGPWLRAYPSRMVPRAEVDLLVRAHHYQADLWLLPKQVLAALDVDRAAFAWDRTDVTDLSSAELEALVVLALDDPAASLEGLKEVACAL